MRGGSWGVWMTVSIACIDTRSLAYDPVDGWAESSSTTHVDSDAHG